MERAEDQTQSSPSRRICSRNDPVHLGSPLLRGAHQLGGALPRASDLSSAKTIYGQENAEPGLIAVTACRDGLLMHLDAEQFSSVLRHQTFPGTNVFVRPF